MNERRGSIVSFEMTVVLFLFAGVYKAAPRFDFIPIDLTALLGLISICSGAYVIYKNNFKIPLVSGTITILAVFFAFSAFSALSILWSPSKSYALSKLFELAVLSGWPLFATAVIIAPSETRRSRFFHAIALLTCWLIIETAIGVWIFGKSEFITPFGTDNYIGFSRALGAGVLVLTYYTIRTKNNYRAGIFATAAFSGLLAMLWLGSRGPFIALVGGVAILNIAFIANQNEFGDGVKSLSLTVGTYGAGVAVGGLFQMRTVRRLALLDGFYNLLPVFGGTIHSKVALETADSSAKASEAVGKSAASRIEYYGAALDYWLAAPIRGQGLGSFAVLFSGTDAREYPHNILLESLSELGIVGAILFLGICLVPVLNLTRPGWTKLSQHSILAFSLVCFAGANAMVSGDLGMNRLFFASIGLLCFTND